MIPLENCNIDIKLSKIFEIEDIPDDLLVKLFHNVENKLLYIWGFRSRFIILHRVFDDKIFKKEVTRNNKA